MDVYRLNYNQIDRISISLYAQIEEIRIMKQNLWTQYRALNSISYFNRYWVQSEIKCCINELEKQQENLLRACSFLNDIMRLTVFYDGEVVEKLNQNETIFKGIIDVVAGGLAGKDGKSKKPVSQGGVYTNDVYKIGKAVKKKEALDIEKKAVSFTKNMLDSYLRKGGDKLLKLGKGKFAKGAKTGCKIGGHLLTGVINWKKNKEEQQESHGTMSNGRVIAETITETAVDIVTDSAIKWVAGGVMTALLGPGAVAAVATGAAVVGFTLIADRLTKKLTKGDKSSFTEFVSDGILKGFGWIGKKCKSSRVSSTPIKEMYKPPESKRAPVIGKPKLA